MRWLRAVGARLRVLWVWPLEYVRANIRNATALASSALRVLHRQRVAPPQPRSDRPVGTKTTTTAEGATTVAVTAPPEAKAKAKEAAAAAAASPGGNARRCGSCGTSGAKARCGRCKSDWYCNASCQKAAWRTHKASCVVITDAPSPSPSPPPPPPFMATEEFKQREPPPKTSEDSSSDDDESSSNADDADEITGRMHAERSAMQAYYREALQAFLQGKWRDAKAGLLHAHTLCEPLADVFVQTECDRMLGYCCEQLSETDQAKTHFEAAVARSERIANPTLEASALVGLGTCLRKRGELVDAKRYLERACTLAQMAEDVPNEAAASSNLGVLLATSDTQKARQLLERAVQLRQEQRGRATTEGEVQEAQRALAGTLTNLAGLVKVTENARAAMSFYKLALEAANQVGDADTASKILMQLSNLYEHDVPGGAAAAAVARADLGRVMTEAFNRTAPDTCSICLDPMDVLATAQDENSRITVLECYHFLHTRCFTSLKQASEQGTVDGQACPECKKRLSFA